MPANNSIFISAITIFDFGLILSFTLGFKEEIYPSIISLYYTTKEFTG